MPYDAICTAAGAVEEPVRWSHMYALMDRLRMAAAELFIYYESPISRADNPFYYADIIPYTLYQTFELDDDGVIEKSYLSRWADVLTPWEFGPTPLENLEANDELMFLADEDGCWCKTLWHIKKTDGAPTLLETSTSNTGCCQTIAVPVVGDRLGSEQVFIPIGASKLHEQKEAEGWLSGPKCRTADSSDGLRFFKQDGRTVAVQREVKGHLTWLIKPRHFQMLLDNIMTVVDGSCGARLDVFPFLCRPQSASPPTLAEMVLVLETIGTFQLPERLLPGCFQRSVCDVDLPWDGPTCGGESCEGSPRLYCTTMQYLNGIISHLPAWLCPPPCLDWADIESIISKHPDTTVTYTPGTGLLVPATLVVTLEAEDACGGSSADRYVFGALDLNASYTGGCKRGRLRVTVIGTGSSYTEVVVSNGTETLTLAGSAAAPCGTSSLLISEGANPITLPVQAGAHFVFSVADNVGGATAPEAYHRGAISVTFRIELLTP